MERQPSASDLRKSHHDLDRPFEATHSHAERRRHSFYPHLSKRSLFRLYDEIQRFGDVRFGTFGQVLEIFENSKFLILIFLDFLAYSKTIAAFSTKNRFV